MSTTTIPALVTWKPDDNVGHPEIDGQHRRLVEILNSLHEAMLARKTDKQLSQILDNLVQYTQQHFAAEERLMAQTAYPGIYAHKKLHHELTAKVVDFRNQLRAGRVSLSIELMHFLKDWLTKHIQGSDREVGFYLRSKGI